MKYLSTTKATGWPVKESFVSRLIQKVLFFIPKANPDYEPKIHLVSKWLIEFIENEGEFLPCREIGLDPNNNIVLDGPNKRNYGFWLDTNMNYNDFEKNTIEKEEFEYYWNKSGIESI